MILPGIFQDWIRTRNGEKPIRSAAQTAIERTLPADIECLSRPADLF